uniref:Uncharacterized protein n=1 Tax=Magnetococcus massalia (strain MO-1) TaxID=451514 RepID=A0A1S7LED7_MAGMO|nr:protein of unknown function [Candidatus Magnetococcus massalia]
MKLSMLMLRKLKSQNQKKLKIFPLSPIIHIHPSIHESPQKLF